MFYLKLNLIFLSHKKSFAGLRLVELYTDTVKRKKKLISNATDIA